MGCSDTGSERKKVVAMVACDFTVGFEIVLFSITIRGMIVMYQLD